METPGPPPPLLPLASRQRLNYFLYTKKGTVPMRFSRDWLTFFIDGNAASKGLHVFVNFTNKITY